MLFHARARIAHMWLRRCENRAGGRRGCSVSLRRIVAGPMSDSAYVYELRHGEEVVATGHLSHPQPLEVGDRVSIGGREGIVRSVEPLLGSRELRLVVQLVCEGL